MIPDFKTYIKESMWGDMRHRSSGEQTRKEDGTIVQKLKIDGVEYKFTKMFWGIGEEYNDENSDEWTCFAFNKMPNGSNIISGDTELAYTFGVDKWDIGEDPYDVYVLKDYFDKTTQELVQNTIKNGNINDIGIAEIENIIVDYVFRIYQEHMSEYAHYWIYELHDSDWSDDAAMFVHTVVDDLDDNVKEEFSSNVIEEAHQIVFPMIDNWYEQFENALTEAYEKLGYIKSETYDLDPFSSPGNTTAICFVKLGAEIENTEEDDENHRDF